MSCVNTTDIDTPLAVSVSERTYAHFRMYICVCVYVCAYMRVCVRMAVKLLFYFCFFIFIFLFLENAFFVFFSYGNAYMNI